MDSSSSGQDTTTEEETEKTEWWNWWVFWVVIVIILIIVFIIIYYRYQILEWWYHQREMDNFIEEDDSDVEAVPEDNLEPTRLKFSDLLNRKQPPRRKWKREERCRQRLEAIYDLPFPKCHPEFLRFPKTNRKLELDGYNDKLKIAFEHNGHQHYDFPNHFHKTRADFDSQQERDRFKNEKCRQMGIHLINIPYTVPYDEINGYIIQRLPR